MITLSHWPVIRIFSRWHLKIHAFRDVFFGALLGSAITLVLFKVFFR